MQIGRDSKRLRAAWINQTEFDVVDQPTTIRPLVGWNQSQ